MLYINENKNTFLHNKELKQIEKFQKEVIKKWEQLPSFYRAINAGHPFEIKWFVCAYNTR